MKMITAPQPKATVRIAESRRSKLNYNLLINFIITYKNVFNENVEFRTPTMEFPESEIKSVPTAEEILRSLIDTEHEYYHWILDNEPLDDGIQFLNSSSRHECEDNIDMYEKILKAIS